MAEGGGAARGKEGVAPLACLPGPNVVIHVVDVEWKGEKEKRRGKEECWFLFPPVADRNRSLSRSAFQPVPDTPMSRWSHGVLPARPRDKLSSKDGRGRRASG